MGAPSTTVARWQTSASSRIASSVARSYRPRSGWRWTRARSLGGPSRTTRRGGCAEPPRRLSRLLRLSERGGWSFHGQERGLLTETCSLWYKELIMTAQRYHIRGSTANEIARSIEDGIRADRLGRGEQLPSVRALAERLEVSPVTVASAYKSLRARGLISTGGRRGTHVAPRPPLGHHALPPVPEGARKLFDGNPDPELLPALDG